MLEMDDETLRWHNSRMTQEQYEVLNDKLTEIMGAEMNTELGGPTRIPEHIRTLMFFLYMANQNSWVTYSRCTKVQHMMWSSRY